MPEVSPTLVNAVSMIQESDIQRLLSSNCEERLLAFRSISSNWESFGPETLHCFSLFSLCIIREDRSPAMRTLALQFSCTNVESITIALRDPCADIRTAALKVVYAQCERKDTVEKLLPAILSLIAIESEEETMLTAISTTSVLLLRYPGRLHRSIVTYSSNIGKSSMDGNSDVFDLLEYNGIVLDLVEHDTPSIRSATAELLKAFISRQILSSRESGVYDPEAVAEAFALLQQLVQDSNMSVCRVAVRALASLLDTDEYKNVSSELVLCEESAKSLFRLITKHQTGPTVFSTPGVDLLLIVLKGYRFDSLTTYAVVETFLRRLIFSARCILTCDETRQFDQSCVLQSLLHDVMHAHKDFARVCELRWADSS